MAASAPRPSSCSMRAAATLLAAVAVALLVACPGAAVAQQQPSQPPATPTQGGANGNNGGNNGNNGNNGLPQLPGFMSNFPLQTPGMSLDDWQKQIGNGNGQGQFVSVGSDGKTTSVQVTGVSGTPTATTLVNGTPVNTRVGNNNSNGSNGSNGASGQRSGAHATAARPSSGAGAVALFGGAALAIAAVVLH